MICSRRLVALSLTIAFAGIVPLSRADGPADNQAVEVRRIPKLGIEVPDADRQELEQGLAKLAATIQTLAKKTDARTKALLPDVQVYYKAVHDALKYQEFFDAKELPIAKTLLTEGQQRADQLAMGQAPWATQTGLVVRGYVSKIDGSVQPYGLVVPASYSPQTVGGHRLDLWFHGRGETLSELNFIEQRRKQVGTFSPPDTIVLHPYGRYSNAFKFAGEVDVLEALEAAQSHYRVDRNRIAVRGFSMGGAACWQFAVHYPTRWFAANPGAGFSETAEFLRVFQKETLDPTWYERKLWRMYDCTDYAVNLSVCPTVAYSGEIDSQKQAADMMQQALAKEGIDLVHIIGPKTAHAYHPQSRLEVDGLMNAIAEQGRSTLPRHVHFTTFTLKYNQAGWVTIDAMKEHWERARVDGELAQGGKIELRTDGVTALTLSMAPGRFPQDVTVAPTINIDGQKVASPRALSDRSWRCPLLRDGDTWKVGELTGESLRKRHGLQGPIDDAFMDAFVFVLPTGTSSNTSVDHWARAEMARAIEHWRRHFRGEARVVNDTAVSDADIASANLVLWGDASSNAVLKRIAGKLPIRQEGGDLVVGKQRFDAEHHAPILIYPNPLNPQRYVVVNSSFTFREYDYLNNARQVPKLPDWAVVDVRNTANSRTPGKIAAADFFGEAWELRPQR